MAAHAFFRPTTNVAGSTLVSRYNESIQSGFHQLHIERTMDLAKQGQNPQYLILDCLKGSIPEILFRGSTPEPLVAMLPGNLFVANTKCASVPPYGCKSEQDLGLAAWSEYGLHLGDKGKLPHQHMVITCNIDALREAALILLDDKNDKCEAVKERFFECAPYSVTQLLTDQRPFTEKFSDFCREYIKEQTENLYAYPHIKKAVLEGKLTIAGCLIDPNKHGKDGIETPITYQLATSDSVSSDFPSLHKELIEKFSGELLPEKPTELNIVCSDSRNIPSLFHDSKTSLILRNPGVFFIPEIFEVEAILQLYPSIKTINFVSHTDCGAMKAMLNPESLHHLPEVEKYINKVKASIKESNPVEYDELEKILQSEKLDPKDATRLAELTEKIRITQIQKLETYLKTRDLKTEITIDGHTFHLEDCTLEHHKSERRTPTPPPVGDARAQSLQMVSV